MLNTALFFLINPGASLKGLLF